MTDRVPLRNLGAVIEVAYEERPNTNKFSNFYKDAIDNLQLTSEDFRGLGVETLQAAMIDLETRLQTAEGNSTSVVWEGQLVTWSGGS